MLEDIIGSRSKISILKTLFGTGRKEYTIRQLASYSDTPYSVAYRDIELLKNESFIKVRKKGPNNIVTLNPDHKMYQRISNLFSTDIKEKKPKKMFKHKEGLIIIHHNADPDAVGSAIALARGLAQSNLKCDIIAPAGISRQSKKILEKFPYPILEKIDDYPKLIFILDTSSPEQLGNIDLPENSKIVVIDHHTPGKLSQIAHLKIIDPSAHSTAVLVYNLLISAGIRITAEIAFFIMIAIVTDSDYFRLVEKRDLIILSQIIDQVNMDDVFASISSRIKYDEKIARIIAVQRARIYTINNKIIMFSKIGSFESSIAKFLMTSFADIAVVENISDKEVRISARARKYLKGTVDLSLMMKGIGKDIGGNGGGHSLAASANGSTPKNIQLAKNKIKRYIEEAFNEKLKEFKN